VNSPGFHRDEHKDLGNWSSGEIYVHGLYTALAIYSNREDWYFHGQKDSIGTSYRGRDDVEVASLSAILSPNSKPRTPTAPTAMALGLDRIVSVEKHRILQSYYKLHMKVGSDATGTGQPAGSQP
jgi:hypothetical protein